MIKIFHGKRGLTTKNGKTINIKRAYGGNIENLKIQGETEQNGIPTPNNPVEIKTVGNPTIKVNGTEHPITATSNMASLPNGVHDEISDKEYKRIGKSVFDGSEEWGTFGPAGKNLLLPPEQENTHRGVTTIISNQVYSINGTREFNPSGSGASALTGTIRNTNYWQFIYINSSDLLLQAGTYTISLTKILGNFVGTFAVAVGDVGVRMGLADFVQSLNHNNPVATFSISSPKYLLFSFVTSNNATISVSFTVLLEKGSTATSYEPYKTAYTLPLSTANDQDDIRVISDKFKAIKPSQLTTENEGICVNEDGDLVVKTDRVDTLAGFKALLGTANLTTYYELATPIEEAITVPDIALEAGTNIVTTTNEVQPNLELSFIEDYNFASNGNTVIKPLKCIETKKKSLNGWYIDVEVPIEYKEHIEKDKLCLVKTKSKLTPQAFRISEKIEYTQRKIIFRADHVFNDARDYFLLDSRPTNLNGSSALNWVNDATDNESPFTVNSDVETTNTAYFINRNLLEAWATIEERWGGVFDIDNWNIQLKQNMGQDRGETITYGKNLQGIKSFEDWSNVVTKLYPIGQDGIMLPEKYIESDIKYDKEYTKRETFESNIDFEEQTEELLIAELRQKAEVYLFSNTFPLVSYEITSNINQQMEIGDIIHVKHPLVILQTEVLEYEYDVMTERVKKIVFGNFVRDVKKGFDNIKTEIRENIERLSSQEETIQQQTQLINMLNKLGHVYIDDNEILVLDELPRANATNVLRIGLGGIGFSNTGYDGDYETAWTLDGTFNANYIKTGILDGALLKAGSVRAESIQTEVLEIGGNNLFINPTGLFGSHGWEGVTKEFTNTEIQNVTFGKRALFLQDGERSQIVQIPNGYYTVSFLYKKLIPLSDCKVSINNEEFDLTEDDWTKFKHTFEVNANQIEIKFISDTNDSAYVSDLMGNSGVIAQKYSSNATEVVTNNVKIGDGIEVSSNASNIKQRMDNDGNRIINVNTNETVAEFTDKGMKVNEIETDKAIVSGTLIQKQGNQTWFSVL